MACREFLDTEEGRGSNPRAPTTVLAAQRSVLVFRTVPIQTLRSRENPAGLLYQTDVRFQFILSLASTEQILANSDGGILTTATVVATAPSWTWPSSSRRRALSPLGPRCRPRPRRGAGRARGCDQCLAGRDAAHPAGGEVRASVAEEHSHAAHRRRGAWGRVPGEKQQRRPDESVRVGFDGPRNRKSWSGKEPVGSPKAVLHFGWDHRPAEDYPPNGSRRRHSGPRRDGLVPHRRRPASQILGFRSEPGGTSLWLNGRDG